MLQIRSEFETVSDGGDWDGDNLLIDLDRGN